PLPLQALPLIMDFLVEGRVARPELRQAVLAAPLPALFSLLGQVLPSAPEIAAVLAKLGAAHGDHPAPATDRRYPLGELLELFWDAEPAETDLFLRQALDWLLTGEERLHHACAA